MKNNIPTLSEAFPFLPDEKLEEVEARLERHIRIVMDMYERISNDPVEHKKFRAALARRKAWKQSGSLCRCFDCQEKFEIAYDYLQSVEPAVATVPDTAPEVTPYTELPVETDY